MKGEMGLVVSRSGRKITALTRSGELIAFRTHRDDFMVGMEIACPARLPFFTWRRLAPAVALSLVLVLVSSFGYRHYLYAQPVMAYVTVDSTGSVELEVNGAGLVTSATPINKEGEEVLSSVQYKNKPAEEVVSAIVKAQDPEKKSDVVVAVIPVEPKSEAPAKKQEKIEKAVSEMEKKVVDGASANAGGLTSMRLGMEVRDAASAIGISAGRAALWALSSKNASEPSDPPPTTGDNEPPGQEEPPVEPVEPVDPVDPTETVQPPQGNQSPDGTSQGNSKGGHILDSIRSSLPQVTSKDLEDLYKSDDSENKQGYLRDLTKNWIENIVKELEEARSRRRGDDDSDDDKDDDSDKNRSTGWKGNTGGNKVTQSGPNGTNTPTGGNKATQSDPNGTNMSSGSTPGQKQSPSQEQGQGGDGNTSQTKANENPAQPDIGRNLTKFLGDFLKNLPTWTPR